MTKRTRLQDFCSGMVLLLTLCTVFAVDLQAKDGIVTGKVCWFSAVVPLCMVLILLTWMLSPPGSAHLRWHAADGFLAALAVLTLVTYRWPIHPEPVRLRFMAQWLLLWGGLRVLNGCSRHAARQAALLLTWTGGLEAWGGLLQGYGLLPSLHARFPITGTFYNPGPLGGCLAMTLPVAVAGLMHMARLKHKQLIRHKKRWRTLLRMQWVCLAGMAVALPASMSRSAWLAAAAGCGVMAWGAVPRLRARTVTWLKGLHDRRAAAWAAGIALACVLLTAGAGLYTLRPGSVTGRLFVARITLCVMARHPAGVGPGGFPAAFAEAQARILGAPGMAAAAARMADSPECAFNEYLQCGAELGWAGLALLPAALSCLLRAGWRRHRYGAAGALTALSVFAMASYPLQLPSFWVLAAVTGCLAAAPCHHTTPPGSCYLQPAPQAPAGRRHRCSVSVGLLAAALLAALPAVPQMQLRRACRTWQFASSLQASCDSTALDLYRRELPRLHHQPEFLFEYALCLNRTGQYAAADSLLGRASLLSGDPVIRAVRGRNAQAMQQFEAAEQHLTEAAAIAPGRMYPHYLLVRLYADSLWHQPGKMALKAADVLRMQPRIPSPATRQMQAEVRALLEAKK